MHIVKYKGLGEDVVHEWKPTNNDDYICGEAEARARFRALVKAGLRGDAVDGIVPWYVTIVDVSRPDKSGKILDIDRIDEPIAPDRRIMLAQFAEKGTTAQGPWAALALAS